jgi:hypothetical protein
VHVNGSIGFAKRFARQPHISGTLLDQPYLGSHWCPSTVSALQSQSPERQLAQLNPA